MTILHSILQGNSSKHWAGTFLILGVICAFISATLLSFSMVKADAANRDLSCLDKNDNNAIDITELFDVIDAYFEGTLDDNTRCVDGNENGVVDITELFDVIDAYFEGTPLSGPTPTPEPTATPQPTATPTPSPTPEPTNTPTPTPSISQDNGDWIYFGPECPGAYPNCSQFSNPTSFINLRAYDDNNEEPHRDPSIRVSCIAGISSFAFDGGGPLIGVGVTGLLIGYLDQDISEGTWYFTVDNTSDFELVWFNESDNKAILQFIEQADHQNRNVSMGAVGDAGGDADVRVVAFFDVTGFVVNYQRLPCS